MWEIRYYDEVDSTMSETRRLALGGAPEGAVVIAERQTEGRGRMGRRFASPPGGGLYLSALLRPPVSPADYVLLTPCVGVCVCRAIEAVCDARAQVKWVNDVLLGGKKVCGILVESVLSAKPFAVLGIGINVNTASFPPGVEQVATSLSLHTGREVSREGVTDALLSELSAMRENFPENVPQYRREYEERLVTLGQTVTILGDETGTPYRVRGLDGRFGLIVEGPDGGTQTLRSGEVSVRRAAK